MNFEMKDVISHGLLDISNTYKVSWQLTNACNYKCSYCFGQDPIEGTKFRTLEELKSVVDKIMTFKKKKYLFTLIGGEITVHPHFIRLLEYLNSLEEDISISIITNGGKGIDYFRKVFEAVKNKEFMIHISIHLEYAKIEHMKDLIKLANEYNRYISFAFMVHPSLMDKSDSYFNELLEFRKQYHFDMYITQLREAPLFDRTDSRYTEKDFSTMDNYRTLFNEISKKSDVKKNIFDSGLGDGGYNIKEGNEIIKNIYIDYGIGIRNNLRDFKNFYCLGGMNLINILHDATYQGGIGCPMYPAKGNIFEDNITDLTCARIKICNQYQCGCDSNDILPKFKYLGDCLNFLNDNSNRFISNIIYNAIIDNNKFDYTNSNEVQTINDKINSIVNTIAWWIPIRKWRDNFRNKMLNTDQTRPDQTRPNYIIYVAITYIFIIIQNIKKYNLCCSIKLQHRLYFLYMEQYL